MYLLMVMGWSHTVVLEAIEMPTRSQHFENHCQVLELNLEAKRKSAARHKPRGSVLTVTSPAQEDSCILSRLSYVIRSVLQGLSFH